jgi:hypothetical protein
MVEEAVEEVLELVRKAAEVFKAAHENDDFDFLADGNSSKLFFHYLYINNINLLFTHEFPFMKIGSECYMTSFQN